MTWTYTCNPASSSVDAVRYLTGQTSTGDPVLVNDEEIEWVISENPGVYAAAVQVLESMLVKYAGVSADSLTVGNLSETYGDRTAKLRVSLANLKRQVALRSVVPVAGGITVADRLSRQADTSLTPVVFSVGMDDNLLAGALEPTT